MSKLSHALITHVESRSLLITMVRQSLETFANNYSGHGKFDCDGGQFIGAQNTETKKPEGHGIFVSRKKDKEVIIAQWDDNGISGQGVRLQRNKAAFCGKWVNEKYDGPGIYFWPDESVQEGQLQNNCFNGHSQWISVNGEVKQGNWVNDVLDKNNAI